MSEIIASVFYDGLVNARRERREGSFALDEAFRTILDLAPPQGFPRKFY